MAIETLRQNPTNQIESLARSLPNREEGQLISAFLSNPIIATKIELTLDYFGKVSPQERERIPGDVAGWAFEWLAFTHLNQHTKHTLFSPQDVSDLYQKLYPTREFKDFFFQGRLPINTRIPDMIEIRSAKNTLQITRIIEAKAGEQLNDNGIITVKNISGNLLLREEGRERLLGQAIHNIAPDLQAKPTVFSPACRVVLAVSSNSSFFQPGYHLEKIPISSATLRKLVQIITPDFS